MTSEDKLKQAKELLHQASENLIGMWEPMLRERKLIEAIGCSMKHRINVERQIIIIMTDYPVSLDELRDTKEHHKVCLWSKN